jgi:hypothetical protein
VFFPFLMSVAKPAQFCDAAMPTVSLAVAVLCFYGCDSLVKTDHISMNGVAQRDHLGAYGGCVLPVEQDTEHHSKRRDGDD